MNTNSWEEAAQRSLDAANREHIERPVRSRRVVRAAAAVGSADG